MDRNTLDRIVRGALKRAAIDDPALDQLAVFIGDDIADQLSTYEALDDTLAGAEVEWGIEYEVTHRSKYTGIGHSSAGPSRSYAEELLDAHREGESHPGIHYGPAVLAYRIAGRWRVVPNG